MKITLRKKDSVISAVLFFYNLYKEYKNEYTARLDMLLETIRYFDKGETSIRTGLSRMVKYGILSSSKEAGETVYKLTEEGIDQLKIWNKGLSRFFTRYSLRQSNWNGIWHILLIENFNKSDYNNQDIVNEIKECGMREINSNVWAAPYPSDEDIIALIEERKFRYLKFSGTLESGKHRNDFLNDAFELTALKEKYGFFLRKAEDTAQKIPALHGGALLPVLFETGWDFFDIVTSDPALPNELLPDWEGDTVVAWFTDFRHRLYPEIIEYFKNNM